jgi:hypothetical protein
VYCAAFALPAVGDILSPGIFDSEPIVRES